MRSSDSGQARVSFTVPAGAGAYAVEELFLKVLEPTVAAGLYQQVDGLTVLVEALPAGATIEIWILRVGGDPTNAAHWFYSGTNYGATGITPAMELGGVNGVKIRAKSGGTAGAMPVNAYWN